MSEENLYQVKTCSKTESFDKQVKDFLKEDIKDILGKNYKQLWNNLNLLVYKHDAILLEKQDKKEPELYKKTDLSNEFVKEIRIFNSNLEFYIWKYNDIFKYRLRLDDIGNEENIYEEEHYIDKRWLIQENLLLGSCKLPKKYKVRNYFKFDNNGLIEFFDARLVCFINEDGGIL